MYKRSCGDCTKCCEGWLQGEALGHKFYPGKPCHFIAIGKGCTVYAKRPKEPCQTYKCAWLIDEDIPEWMKPSDINTILTYREVNGIPYLHIKEAGSELSSKVLSWAFLYCLRKNMNLYWEINGGANYMGSKDFLREIEKPILPLEEKQFPSKK
jgi:hypothetical protein